MEFLLGQTPCFDSDGDDYGLDDDDDDDDIAELLADLLDEEDKTCLEASPGFRVIRGPDWAFKNQDGGEGHVGTVIGVEDSCQPAWPDGTVLVQWDNGNKGLYRTGHERAYDLRVMDTSCASCIHWRVWCDGCDKDDIAGIRWRCTQCFAIDLCTECYMGDKHDLDHVFMRVNTSETSSLGPRMLPRRSTHHEPVMGIFPGARVVEFPDWFPRKPGNLTGRVTSLRTWRVGEKEEDGRVQADFGQGVMSRTCGEREGHVELACTIPGPGGQYYIGHLPKLGYNDCIEVGDTVVVSASHKEVEELQRRHGLWDTSISNILRKEGVVIEKLDLGDLVVQLEDDEQVCTINPVVVKQRHSFCPGENVRISSDIDMVKRLQSGHGGWTADMKKIIGAFGKVLEVDGKDVRVEVDKKTYIVNGACLSRVCLPSDRPKAPTNIQDTKKAFMRLLRDPFVYATTLTDSSKFEHMLDEKPHMVHHETFPGKPLVSVVAANCNLQMLKVLVEKGALVETVDVDGYTPLMKAAAGNKWENVKYLLEKGANVNAVGALGTTSFHLALRDGHTRCADILLQHGADVNLRSLVECPPLIEAVTNSQCAAIFDMMLKRTDTDLKAVNDQWESAVHLAVGAKRERPLEKLLEKVPRLGGTVTLFMLTPLMIAATGDAFIAAEILLQKGQCDINAKEPSENMTALIMATVKLSVNVLQLLVKHGADLNIRNKAGNTALQIALNMRNSGGVVVPDHSVFTEMKRRWKRQRIRTNEEALLAYLVWNGADLEALNCENISIIRTLHVNRDPIAHALTAVQRQRRQMMSKKTKTSNVPNMPKERKEHPKDRSTGRKHMNAYFRRGDSKQSRCEHPEGARPEDKSHHSEKDASQPGTSQETSETNVSQSDTDHDAHLKAQIRQRDEEIASLRRRLDKLDHLVKKKITFACGHDVTYTIAELIPECPICCEPITKAIDVEN